MKKLTSTYLKNLKYDKKLENKAISKYLVNPRMVFLLVLTIIMMGIFSVTNLPRTLNPVVDITIVSVSTVLPGADPSDVEQLITIPLEDSIESVENVASIDSTSTESLSIISIEFDSGIDPKIAEQDIKRAVDSVSDLPDDATDPNVAAFDFENQPVLVSSLSTKEDVASLINLSDVIKDKLEDSSKIDRVVLTGTEEQEIQILVDQESSISYGINPISLKSQIESGLSSFPTGVVTSGENNFSFNIDRTITDVDDIRSLPINTPRGLVQLSNIADVSYKSKPNQLSSYSINGKDEIERAVVISVFKSKNAKADEVGAIAQEIIDSEIEKYNGVFTYHVSVDLSKDISDQFSDLSESFSQTLILVFITLLVFIGIKQSLIVALSIPLTFFISFTAMSVFDLSLNFLSVFSLLLALGLLVDDAIVITSAMNAYNRTKKFTSEQTGLLVWKDFIVPIWSTTITTVWAFVPLLLASGIIGAFIKTIPVVVSATLIASTAVAVLITLPTSMQMLDLKMPKRVVYTLRFLGLLVLLGLYLAFVPKNPMPLFVFGFIVYVLFLITAFDARSDLKGRLKIRNKRLSKINLGDKIKNGFINSAKFSVWYKDRISKIIESRKKRRLVVVGVVVFSLISYLLVPLGFVKNEFFPKIDSKLVFVSLELPNGTTYTKTDEEAKEILTRLSEYEDVEFVLAEVGRLPNQFSAGAIEGEHTARFSLNLKEENSIEMAQTLRDDFADYTKGKISVIEESGGPPVGADIQVTFKGSDLGTLENIATEAVRKLEETEGVTNISVSATPSTSRINFVPNESILAQRGISVPQLGFASRSFVTGLELDTLREGDSETDIVYRVSDERVSVESLGEIMIATPQGAYPLSTFGDVVAKESPSIIRRVDKDRTITVSAGILPGYSVPELNAQIGEYIDSSMELPQGYVWETGGVNEENQDSVNSILQAMVLAAILIMATMVVQLGSFRKAFIVLLVIPLAITGVFYSFALTGTPLSFPALIGLLALFGIVVNNSIVVVEKINQNLRVDIGFKESVADGAASRVEPIMFSSLTTIFGLLPITLSDPLWRGLGGAIISGLLVSGSIMLIFIPVVYYSWFASDSLKRKK